MKRIVVLLLCVMLFFSMLPMPSQALSQYATVVGGWLRLRAAASFNAETINSYYTGTSVKILGAYGNWYHVQTPDSLTGYMYGQYLNFSGGSGTGDAYVTSYNGYGVRLRQGPSTAYRVIRTYAVGTPVTVLQKGTNWCYVSIYGTKGYMMSQFLSFDGGSPEPVIDYATVWSSNGYGVRLRTGPGKSYSKIGVYSVGTTVSVLQKGAVWDKVRVGSRTGWMMNEFLIYQGSGVLTSVAINNTSPVVWDTIVATVTPSGASYTCQWYRNGSPISGATSSAYLVTTEDIGKSLSVVAIGKGNYSGSVSAATGIVKDASSEEYALNVIGGEDAAGKGNYKAGETVTVKALVADISKGEKFVFSSWTANGITLSASQLSSSVISFSMPSNNVTITGSYLAIPPTSNYSVTVDNGSYEYAQAFAPGDPVTISAAVPEGKVFSNWMVSGIVLSISELSSETLSFTMPENDVTAKAICNTIVIPPASYSLTIVDNGTITGSVESGKPLSITAGVPDGSMFTGWTAVGVTLTPEELLQNPLVFTMPANDVTVIANYAPLPELEFIAPILPEIIPDESLPEGKKIELEEPIPEIIPEAETSEDLVPTSKQLPEFENTDPDPDNSEDEKFDDKQVLQDVLPEIPEYKEPTVLPEISDSEVFEVEGL